MIVVSEYKIQNYKAEKMCSISKLTKNAHFIYYLVHKVHTHEKLGTKTLLSVTTSQNRDVDFVWKFRA